MDFHLAILSVTPWSSAPVRSNYLHNAKMFKRQVASTVPWRGMSRVRARPECSRRRRRWILIACFRSNRDVS